MERKRVAHGLRPVGPDAAFQPTGTAPDPDLGSVAGKTFVVNLHVDEKASFELTARRASSARAPIGW